MSAGNMRRLESIIEQDPASWLWTHRRWKHHRSPETPLYEG
ncbi:MAG: hypothetical protein KDC54_23055 [Lewinella sp.]|nr:hypothetical protein [Lewinella sp.]